MTCYYANQLTLKMQVYSPKYVQNFSFVADLSLYILIKSVWVIESNVTSVYNQTECEPNRI